MPVWMNVFIICLFIICHASSSVRLWAKCNQIITVHPEGNINVWTAFRQNPSNSCWDISVWPKWWWHIEDDDMVNRISVCLKFIYFSYIFFVLVDLWIIFKLWNDPDSGIFKSVQDCYDQSGEDERKH